jgi:hypothetical protein
MLFLLLDMRLLRVGMSLLLLDLPVLLCAVSLLSLHLVLLLSCETAWQFMQGPLLLLLLLLLYRVMLRMNLPVPFLLVQTLSMLKSRKGIFMVCWSTYPWCRG